MKHILVIENVEQIEDRFQRYLNEYHSNDKIETLTGIGLGRVSQKEVTDFLKTTGATDLVFESTLANRDQLLKLAGALVKFKDEISFKEITILYTYNELDVFLNSLVRQDSVAKEIFELLFDIYTVNTIEWKVFEQKDDSRKYFKQQHFFYQKLQVFKESLKDGSYIFELEHSAYIDPREGFRPSILVPFKRDLIFGRLADNFFGEVKAFLEYQKDVIESDSKNKDYEGNRARNEENLLMLNYIQGSINSKR